jgi:hypothetical protein
MLRRTPEKVGNTTTERVEEWLLESDAEFFDPEDHSFLKITKYSV